MSSNNQDAQANAAISSGGTTLSDDQITEFIKRTEYNVDKDLVQNMRNCMTMVKGFKQQIDAIVLASGYGGWTIIAEDVDPEDRIEGLMYIRVLNDDTYRDTNGKTLIKYNVRAETSTGTILSFFSDSAISTYDNSDSYYLTSNTVKDAIDELSNRSILLEVTVPADAFTATVANSTNSVFGDYMATIDVPEMLSTDYPIVTDITNHIDMSTIHKQASLISKITTGNGYITIYCNDAKPSLTMKLLFRILRGNGKPKTSNEFDLNDDSAIKSLF